MDAALRLGLRHALDAVTAAFEAEMAVGAVALDIDDDFLEPAALAGGEIADDELPAMRLGIPAVHLKQVADKERRLIAAGARPQFQEERIDHVILRGNE